MLHDRLRGYLETIAQAIDALDAIYLEKYEEEILTPNRCNVRIRIRWSAGDLLEINEAVIVTADRLHHLNYRYHFQDVTNTIHFRYDNSPHHQDIDSFPHHKHTRDGVVETERPTISDVINEVKGIVEPKGN